MPFSFYMHHIGHHFHIDPHHFYPNSILSLSSDGNTTDALLLLSSTHSIPQTFQSLLELQYFLYARCPTVHDYSDPMQTLGRSCSNKTNDGCHRIYLLHFWLLLFNPQCLLVFVSSVQHSADLAAFWITPSENLCLLLLKPRCDEHRLLLFRYIASSKH